MPKEKLLFFIGVWIILLAYFIGLPTEIKNIVFLATGLVVIAISYGSYFSKIKNSNYFNKKENYPIQKKQEVKKSPIFETRKSIKEDVPVGTKEEVREVKEVEVKKPEEEKLNFNQYEAPIKVRKSRARKPKFIREESIIVQDEDDTDDVIVISSDGDN